jgi:hypothetical protein
LTKLADKGAIRGIAGVVPAIRIRQLNGFNEDLGSLCGDLRVLVLSQSLTRGDPRRLQTRFPQGC